MPQMETTSPSEPDGIPMENSFVCPAGIAPSEIVFAGGASKGDIWCQILADVLGLPVKVPVVKEATALGAAILAGYGVGVFPDISATARRLVKWD